MQKLINLTHGQEKNILEPLLTGIFLIPPLEYVLDAPSHRDLTYFAV